MRWLRYFGISRTGIRKVLQRLALEQLIYTDAGQGAQQWRGRLPRKRGRFLMRGRLIECALMARLASRISAAQVTELRAMAQQEQQALKGTSRARRSRPLRPFMGGWQSWPAIRRWRRYGAAVFALLTDSGGIWPFG